MSLTIGTVLGNYEIHSALGAGGMGEVYRARDTRLGRDVAIKVLPAAFTMDAGRLARFEREARVLASLNHSNIAAIYGVEEIRGPAESGPHVRALVLELVDGETLADRIVRGLDVREALDIARQIAEALDAAHEKGIIHRDLKPANVKITPTGVVKVLDFGLAKQNDSSAPDLTDVATLTMGETREGTLLGTVPYMSPEQARGHNVDRRTDLWAFGCVLFEMLTRQPAFSGATAADTIASILEREPNWSALPSATPPAVRQLLRRSLTKNSKRRMRDAGDVVLDLETAGAAQDDHSGEPIARRPRWLWPVVLALALVAAGAIALVASRRAVDRDATLPTAVMTRITADAGLSTEPSISADGRLVVYASNRSGDGNLDVYVQQTTGGASIRLTNDPADDREPDVSPDGSVVAFRSDRTPQGVYIAAALGGGARLVAPEGRGPRFSPDGRSLAFWTGGWLAPRSVGTVRHAFIVPAEGGMPVQVAQNLASAGDPVWSPDGRSLLLYGRRAISGSNTRPDWWWVSSDGGSASPLGAYDAFRSNGIELDNTDVHPFPGTWTPDGVVFTARLKGSDDRGLWRIPIDQKTGALLGPPSQITNGTTLDVSPSVSRDGRLVFAAQTAPELLFAMPFDGNSGKPLGPLRRVREDSAPSGRSSVSGDGRLVAFPKYEFASGSLWVRDLRSGQERQLAATPRTPLNPVLSVDGRWVAYTVTTQETGGSSGPGIGYVVESSGGVPKKVCDLCQIATWTRDNRQVVITDADNSSFVRIDVQTGARIPLVIGASAPVDRPMFGPNGSWMSFNTASGILLAPVHEDRPSSADEWTVILKTTGPERTAGMSPDGRLLYVLLERDGFRCLYAIKLDAANGRPMGEPFLVSHFHDAARRWGTTGFGSAVASDLVMVSLFETTSNIWVTTLNTRR